MFTPQQQHRIVPGTGNKNAPICIIGEAPGTEEDRLLRPFVGAAGTVLESCLHAAGLTRSDCYITNIIKVKPSGGGLDQYYNSSSGTFTDAGHEWLNILEDELLAVQSNVIVALGSTALSALTGRKSIVKYRGYVHESLSRFGRRKIIPAYHPAASLRGQYIIRYYIVADLKKAKLESAYPDIRRPERKIIIPTTIAEVIDWASYLMEQPIWAVDIEVMNFEVSAIGFASSQDLAISFPLSGQHWSEDDECTVWFWMNKLLTSGARKVFQNGIFDISFLLNQCAIHVQPPIEDTMIAHHIMYPDMLKGLGFLGSMYCGSQEFWKDAVKWDNIKDES